MLTNDESNYIEKIPEDKVVVIIPYSIRAKEIADEIKAKINEKLPDLKVMHMGASGLGISGQGDIDIYALASLIEIESYFPIFQELFGEPVSKRDDSITWEMEIEGYPIELYLTDPNSKPMQRQLKVFQILKDNPKLLDEYKDLKEKMNGKSFREYQKQKYEFYHRILDD
jgi:GrpB-like predicted nucleotidyltransferase (UPF0157 family)